MNKKYKKLLKSLETLVQIRSKLLAASKDGVSFIVKGNSVSVLKFNDVTDGILFSREDFDYIKKKYDLIRHYGQTGQKAEKHKAVKNFEVLQQRYKNGQTAYDDAEGRYYEPLDKTCIDDLVTHGGKQRIAELATGEHVYYFSFMCIGTSRKPVLEDDNKLYAELPNSRASIFQQGYASGGGGIIKHSCMFSPELPSYTGGESIFEVGVVDTDTIRSDQTLLTRSIFPENKPLTHIQGQDFFTLTNNIYMTSVDVDEYLGQISIVEPTEVPLQIATLSIESDFQDIVS